MKSTQMIISILSSLVWVAVASATTNVQLQWDPNTESDLAGYKIYYKADSSAMPLNGTGATEGSAPIDVHNQTSATVSGLDPAHAYSFAITAYNTSGVESGYSNMVTITESAPPSVSLTFPSNNSNVSGTVLVTADATDNVGVTKVEYYVNGVLKGSDTTATYQYSWDTASVAPGVYTLYAKAYDAAGNVGQSSTLTVTVVNDVSAPTISMTAPANNAILSGTVTISAAASDNVGVSKVEFYQNGLLAAAMNTGYNYSWNTSAVPNGSYTLTAKAYDAANHVTTSSAVAVTVNNPVPDITAPSVTAFTTPSTSTSLSIAISSFTASDSAGVTGFQITESNAAPAAGAAGWKVTAPTSYTFTTAGSKTLYAWAKDAAGNVSSSLSRSVTITLPDTAAPAVSITTPVNSSTVSGSVNLSATVSDNVGVSKVEFYVNGILKATSVGSQYNYSWDTSVLTNGSYTLSAMAYDAAGNVGQSGNVAVTVSNVIAAPTPAPAPAVVDMAPVNIVDAMQALNIAVGKVKPTSAQMARLDLAPVINGKSSPNGKIDTGDAIVLLSRLIGKIVL